MASEADAFSDFLAPYLQAETGVEAWEEVPLGGYPCITYRLMSSFDLMIVNARRVWAEGTWQVIGENVGEGTRRVGEIAAAIDTAMYDLHHIDLGDGIEIQEVTRIGEFRRSVTQGDEQRIIRRRGGTYRVRVRVND